MILVDTPVWIDHLHRSEPDLQALLRDDAAATHEGILAELALGSIARRQEVIALLSALTRTPRLRHDELLSLIETERLWGRGLSATDVGLLGSARLARAAVWTRDRRLRAAAVDLDVPLFDGTG